MNVDILEWIKTGKFGDIDFTSTRSQVRSAIGNPDRFGPDDGNVDTFWQYGSVRIHFAQKGSKDLVRFIYMELPHSSQSIKLKGWNPDGLRMLDVLDLIRNEKIPYEIERKAIKGDFDRVIIGNRVRFAFNNTDKEMRLGLLGIESAAVYPDLYQL